VKLGKGVHVRVQLFYFAIDFYILSGVILIENFWLQFTQREIGRLELFLLLLELTRFDSIIFDEG
jgi:hypothetical protein